MHARMDDISIEEVRLQLYSLEEDMQIVLRDINTLSLLLTSLFCGDMISLFLVLLCFN